MSTIDINVVKFTEGPLKGQWGVCVDYWSEYILYNADGKFIIAWNRDEEQMAADEFEMGAGEPTHLYQWWQENKFETFRSRSFSLKMMETMVVVGEQFKEMKTLLMGVGNISGYVDLRIEEFKNPKPQPEPVDNFDWDIFLRS